MTCDAGDAAESGESQDKGEVGAAPLLLLMFGRRVGAGGQQCCLRYMRGEVADHYY
jgi:hypothetical protein